MELKYVVMTIIKILISVPAVLLLHSMEVNGAALMGGHYDNKNNTSSTNLTNSYLIDYDVYDSQEQQSNNNSTTTPTTATNLENKHNNTSENVQNSEQVPNPSPLVVPGYNLPENIFNKGKPFYLEKDPLTGHIDFNSKSSVKLDDDLYDYVDDEPNDNIYDKSNIDRKDGSLNEQQQQHHHRPSDVNQLTPNFHDFLNLPVKYNSDKYIYPLISSSYANTKIQGNVNKYQNHKNYNVKTSTEKPTVSPTYYSSTNKNYFNPHLKTTTKRPELTTTTTTTTTTQRTTTGKPTSLLTGAMGHPSFNEDFEYDYYETTKKQLKPNEIYLTTENVNNIYLTSKASTTTTKRPMSLFEQLFGEYEDEEAVMERTKPPPLFVNLPSNKNTMNKFDGDIKTENQSNFTTPNGQNVLTGTNMGLESSYEYEDDYSNGKHEDSIAVETRPVENNTTIIVANSSSSSQIEHKMPNEYIDEKEEEYSSNNTDYSEYDYQENVKYSTPSTTTTTIKVTSLPLGENHVTGLNNRQPIIVATQNLKEKLNSEKISTIIQHAPSTSNIHIAPDQDTVSFVVGNHQNVDGGQYVGTSLKESPYDSNPFRPLFGQEATYSNQDSVSYKIHGANNQETIRKPIQNYPEIGGASSVTIQPLKNSEASLAIGVPVNNVKQVPGQVVDEKLDIKNEQIQFPKGNGPKIIFPDDKESTDLVPATIKSPQKPQLPPPNREVLQLASQPMYHQLPSDLTPPKEQIIEPPKRIDRPRPPWDPRPGHFYSGKPEYARPARPPPPPPRSPPSPTEYKRIDNLPNILPQFRPNMKMNGPPPPPPQHYFDKLVRQPLLERPSNRPIGFFEKLQPPPPPLSHNFHNLRKIQQQQQPLQSLDDPHNIQIAEDRIMNDGPKKADQFDFYHTPPKVPIANRRHANDGEVETLQMIQAKNVEKRDFVSVISANNSSEKKNGTEKPLYVVYPVNANPVKLNTIDNNRNKEAVVVGTRAELPLPPSKINKNFIYEQNPLLNPKDRSDSPVLKPHPRPSTFPIKSDFPYPLERPDPASIHPAVPETPSNNGNNLDEPLKFDEPNPTSFVSNNQWNTIGEQIESRIVTGSKLNSNQISVTLKTYTEKPIAVAYTPTAEPALYDFNDKFSMPNYGSIVIPEIRKGTVNNDQDNGEFTVSAVMHTRLQSVLGAKNNDRHAIEGGDPIEMNHKIIDSNPPPTQLDFQAPFQASVSIDSVNQGWSVVRDKNKTTTEETAELTTVPIATTSEFDIENFKPELIGGFKPIYNFPDDERRDHENINEREE